MMTIEEIKREFGIKSNNISEIRKELRDIVKEIHPDKNEGLFKTEKDESKYHKTLKAIEFLDQDFSLVPKVEITALATMLRDQLPSRKEGNAIKILEDRGVRFLKSIKDSAAIPKVSSTVIATILSFLWLFPSTIAEHPILSKYLTADNLLFTGIWLYSIMFSGIYWLTAKTREDKIDSAVKRLNLESVQNRLFKSFIQLETYSQERTKVLRFTKDDFIEYLTNLDMITLDYSPGRLRRSLADILWFMPTRKRNINLELSQILADIIIERVVGRGLIEVEKGKGLSDTYLYETLDKEYGS